MLGQRGLDPRVPILLRLVEHDPDPSVRQQCMSTLSYAFKPPAVSPAAVPALITGLKSGDVKVRSQAASIVGTLKADARAAVPELLRILSEPIDPNVLPAQRPSGTFAPGCAAAHALGQIVPGFVPDESKKVIAPLIEVAKSDPV
jgi:HEAT repeat protein